MVQMIKQWTVQGYYANTPMFGFSEESGITQASATEEYEIQGGESIYDTLYRNGLIENPMPDANTYRCEWVANRWWAYRAQIAVTGEHPRVSFEGVDGAFTVWFKNRFLGRHFNSYVPFEIDLSEYAGQEGTLMAIVESPEGSINQSGYTSKITSQRTRFDFKWDFCPRMISLGLVAPVLYKTGAEIFDVKITAQPSGEVRVKYAGKYFPQGARVAFSLAGKTVSSQEREGELSLAVENPALWYCNGAGKPALYTVVLRVEANGFVLWEKEYNVGFRTVEFVKNENAPENSLPYTLVLNGKKTYIKGVNFVPLEMSRAQYTAEKYEKILTLAKEMNVNFVRVWGGGVIETEEFYNACDRLGLLVWQDFMQSSSGIDNCATVIKEGLAALVQTAECAVGRLRNHPSLALYCGGNELMDNWVPLGFDHPNIAALKEVVDRLDGERAMLPTTASGPLGVWQPARAGKGEHHDIHGPWKFTGNTEHYELYNKSDCLFHGEFGVDGFCNEEIVDKILTPAQRKMSTVAGNYIWRHKAEWWDQLPQTEKFFGKSESLAEQIGLSQYLQAEALRYAAEANRRRAFENSGEIVWQLNEPYPNLCCTNLVDYFCNPKAACFALKRAYAAVNPNMRYDKLCYEGGETISLGLYLTSELAGEFSYTVQIEAGGERKTLSYTVAVRGEGKTAFVDALKLTAPQEGGIRFVLGATNAAGKTYTNEILLLVRGKNGCSKKEALAYVARLKANH